jgi:hypothetical protein
MALALAAAVIMPVAANATNGHRHHAHHRGQMANTYLNSVGPAWRGPNQCFEDLGYGRYESCDQ